MGLKKAFASTSIMRFLAQNTPLMGGVAKKLVPAVEPEEAVEVAAKLADMGYRVCLHHLGKASNDVSEIQDNIAIVNETLEILDEEKLEMCVSVMPSEMGYLKSARGGEGHCKQIGHNFARRIEARTIEGRHVDSDSNASDQRDLLMLHASERVTMQRVLALYGNLSRAGVAACVTIPAGLARSVDDVKKIVSQGGRVRLSLIPAHVRDSREVGPDEDDALDNYAKLARILLSEDAIIQRVYPVFALESEEMANRIKQLADLEGWLFSDFEFEIPFGVNNPLKRALRDEGYNVRVLVPFGKEWWPYYLKRSQV